METDGKCVCSRVRAETQTRKGNRSPEAAACSALPERPRALLTVTVQSPSASRRGQTGNPGGIGWGPTCPLDREGGADLAPCTDPALGCCWLQRLPSTPTPHTQWVSATQAGVQCRLLSGRRKKKPGVFWMLLRGVWVPAPKGHLQTARLRGGLQRPPGGEVLPTAERPPCTCHHLLGRQPEV